MKKAVFFVLLNLCTASLALDCRVVPGSLKQIDAGNGQVFGVNSGDEIFTLFSTGWTKVPGSMQHVSVGPSGVWGVDSANYIYKLVGGEWIIVPGLLKQVDAGGTISPAGVNMNDDIFCLPSGKGSGWVNIPGRLKYYSCGPYSCWGVNSANAIYIMKAVTQTSCAGSKDWEQVPGALSMIEVSTDRKVYGVNASGDLFTRDGVKPRNPAGTGWRQIPFSQKFKHASYDMGHLWLITKEGSIIDCTDCESNEEKD